MKKYFWIIGLIFLALITLESFMRSKKIDANNITIGFMGDVMIGN